MHRIRVFPVMVLLLAVVAPAAAWVVRIQGDDGPSGVASGVAVGGDGTVIASGITRNTGSSYDWTVVELDPTTGAEAWRYMLDGDDPEDDPHQGKSEVPNGPAIDAAGDVIVTGIVTGADFQTDVVVVKVDGDTGGEVWQTTFDGAAHDDDSWFARAALLGGDPVVGATLDEGSFYAFDVARLDGADGTEAWRTRLNGMASTAFGSDLTVDGAGDVLALGTVAGSIPGDDILVAKLDGATGMEEWRETIAGTGGGSDDAYRIITDATGNVIVAGQTDASGFPIATSMTVVRLAGATGAEQWRFVLDDRGEGSMAVAAAVDAAGDVTAVGTAGNRLQVVKLAGATGALLWQRRLGKSFATDVAVDALGDVVVAGAKRFSFFAMKLAGPTGKVLWKRGLKGNTYNAGVALDVALTASGDAIVGGRSAASFARTNANEHNQLTVQALCGPRGRECPLP